jgi:hypothetical protein
MVENRLARLHMNWATNIPALYRLFKQRLAYRQLDLKMNWADNIKPSALLVFQLCQQLFGYPGRTVHDLLWWSDRCRSFSFRN